MYYRDEYDNGSTSGSSSPATPSADHRLFSLASSPRRAPITAGAWAASHSHNNNNNQQSETTREVLQSVLKVRKSWKTLRGGETVWPLELEAALLEGLESYVPDDSRETRLLGRFPRRNRFISDYIFEKTGKRRSAKQVGSRLQQLRESCGGKKLLHLLSPFRQPYPDSSASSASDGGQSSCTSPVSPLLSNPQSFASPSMPRHTIVYIDIVPSDADSFLPSTPATPTWEDANDVVRASDRARRMHEINPSVAFVATSPISGHSRFTVYAEDRVMHSANAPLVPTSTDSPVDGGLLYNSALVPEFWSKICDSPDPTRFTIYQEVLRDDTESLMFSATYKFVYPEADTGAGFGLERSSSTSSASEMDALLSAASFVDQRQAQRQHETHPHAGLQLSPTPDRGYPLYLPQQHHHHAASWSSVHSHFSRENSPRVGSSSSRTSSTGDPMSLCFPPDLTNYVL